MLKSVASDREVYNLFPTPSPHHARCEAMCYDMYDAGAGDALSVTFLLLMR